MTAAAGEERPVTLREAPGLDFTEANCGACHSLDYITMNSPFLNAAQWDAEVAKMINAFGAQISEADAKAIADYLVANYGEASAQVFPPERRGCNSETATMPGSSGDRANVTIVRC
jgi:mono/diheme cytochrome c family protein